MIKIAIIGFYYGRFPAWIQYWLRSCNDNPTIDFILITDIELNDCPPNVTIITKSLKQVKEMIENKIQMKIALDKPYKLCDYRPLYGLLLEDYLIEYDYWGHCDFDLIWGDIRKFVELYDIKIYDKFLPLGHLSLYRNTNKVNHYYELNGSKCGDYKIVFGSNENFAFDETGGIYAIYEYNNLPMFTKRIFAEIKTFHRRFRLKHCDKNYKHQVFYYENGNVYRAYQKEGKIKAESYIYIHFRRNLTVDERYHWKELNSFYITPDGFFDKKAGLPTIEEIDKYNSYPGFLVEMGETILFCLKNMGKIKTKIENEWITFKSDRGATL